MYFKLAFKNVKKSYRDYFVYFITLTISVSLFYLFNSFDAQQKILVTESTMGLSTLNTVMGVLSYLVTFVFGFLILYANNFIMKRRKKEMALYTLLGMKKSHMSRILLYETFFVGLTSLLSGLVMGVFLSQGAAALTARILAVDIAYQFIISAKAIGFTLISFSLIFVIVAIFNNLTMSRAKLIDLFKSNVSNDISITKNPFIVSIVMILSITTLAYLYKNVLTDLFLIKNLVLVLVSGSIATFGIFYSLSFWFVKISQSMKKYYYKDLNAFSTRQISSKIKMTYKLLANVSLMLLLSFGALATSFNVQSIINGMFNKPGSFDYSIQLIPNEEIHEDMTSFFNFSNQYEIKNTVLYNSGLQSSKLGSDILNMNLKSNPLDLWDLDLLLLSLDDYNYYRTLEGKEALQLNDNEAVYYLPQSIINLHKDENALNQDFELLNTSIHIKDYEDYYSELVSIFDFVMIVNEETLSQLLSNVNKSEASDIYRDNTYLYSINFASDQDPQVETDKVVNIIRDRIEKDNSFGYNTNSRYKDLQTAKDTTLLLTYLGLYIGLTFIVVSVMVLSLQLLSEASDNYERYLLLDKIGVSRKQQKKSIFRQNLTYFGLPLLVALVHSFVGISAVNNVLAIGGLKTENPAMILIAVGILLCVYILYFIVTYLSSVRMIFDRKH